MVKMSGVGTRSLEWVQPQWTKRSYELRAAGVTVASLRFTGTLKEEAHATTGGTSYRFNHSGFIHRKIAIVRSPFDQEIGSMALRWNGTGTVSLIDGRSYELTRPSMWRNIWRILDPRGEEVARINLRSSMARNQGQVVLKGEIGKDAMLDMVLVLAWYAVALSVHNATVAAGGAEGAR
jgi:hypothetical protein